jgi:hypothetical protein
MLLGCGRRPIPAGGGQAGHWSVVLVAFAAVSQSSHSGPFGVGTHGPQVSPQPMHANGGASW